MLLTWTAFSKLFYLYELLLHPRYVGLSHNLGLFWRRRRNLSPNERHDLPAGGWWGSPHRCWSQGYWVVGWAGHPHLDPQQPALVTELYQRQLPPEPAPEWGFRAPGIRMSLIKICQGDKFIGKFPVCFTVSCFKRRFMLPMRRSNCAVDMATPVLSWNSSLQYTTASTCRARIAGSLL